MQIVKGIDIVDLGLFIVKHRILIITDTQLGYDESLNKKGIMVPRFQFTDIKKRLSKILELTKPKIDKPVKLYKFI